MRTLSVLVVIAAALQGCAPPAVRPDVPGAIETLLPAIARAFSACDLEALGTIYAPDIEFISPSTPSAVVGWPAVRDHLAGACTTAVRPVMSVESQRVRMLSPDAAVVTGHYAIGRTDQPHAKPWRAHFVATVRATQGRWLVSTQASVPVP